MTNLLPRIVTALILIPLMLGGIFWLPLTGFAVFIGLIALLGAWEWGALSGFCSIPARAAYVLAILAVLLALYAGVHWPGLPLPALLLTFAILWVAALFVVALYPAGASLIDQRASRAVLGGIVLAGMWLGFYSLRAEAHGRWLVLLVMFMVWGADIGAYFVGRWLGRHKLAPQVSPGKTWEGVLGGTLGAVLLSGSLLASGLPYQVTVAADLAWWILMTVCVVAASIVGDLVESMIKRSAGCKDSGRLLPGHGGVLDRIDSMSAAAPVLAAWLYFWPGL